MNLENHKNNYGLIAFVIVLVLLVLALGGYIAYDKVLLSNSKQTNNNTNTKTNVNNGVIDDSILNDLFDIIGVSHSGKDVRDCLNYYVSSNDYKNSSNVYQIFSWLGQVEKYSIPMYEPCWLLENGSCAPNGDTLLVTKSDIEKAFKVYGITKSIDDYNDIFKPYVDGELKVSYERVKNYDSSQKYYTFTPAHHVGNCNYDVTHFIDTKADENNDIVMIDMQNITEYEWDNIHFDSTKKVEKNIITKNVTYTFKKDSDGNYNLNNVVVK